MHDAPTGLGETPLPHRCEVSSRIDEQLARDEISFRRNGHYPTIDLVAGAGNVSGDSTTDIVGVSTPDRRE